MSGIKRGHSPGPESSRKRPTPSHTEIVDAAKKRFDLSKLRLCKAEERIASARAELIAASFDMNEINKAFGKLPSTAAPSQGAFKQGSEAPKIQAAPEHYKTNVTTTATQSAEDKATSSFTIAPGGKNTEKWAAMAEEDVPIDILVESATAFFNKRQPLRTGPVTFRQPSTCRAYWNKGNCKYSPCKFSHEWQPGVVTATGFKEALAAGRLPEHTLAKLKQLHEATHNSRAESEKATGESESVAGTKEQDKGRENEGETENSEADKSDSVQKGGSE